jgi:hypothetical protein
MNEVRELSRTGYSVRKLLYEIYRPLNKNSENENIKNACGNCVHFGMICFLEIS